jgi:hypothetical protein
MSNTAGNWTPDSVTAVIDGILADNGPEDSALIIGQFYTENPGAYDAVHLQPIADGVRKRNPGPDAAMMTQRYLEGVGNAASRYVQGMQNPRRNPKEAALRAKGKWANRTQEAIQRDAYAQGIQRYDVAEAVAIATGDGGMAYTQGAQKRADKVGRAMSRLAPLMAGVSTTIQNMPQDSDAQREARLLQARKLMIQVGQQYKSGR